MPRFFDRIKPGLVIDRQTAATLNRALELLEALSLPRSTGEVGLVSRPGGIAIFDQRPFPETWWVSIDGPGVTSQRYEDWTRVEDQGDGTFAAAGDDAAGGPTFPGFLPPGWPIPAAGSVAMGIPAGDGESLLLITPAASAGTAPRPVVNNYGPYVTWHFVGPAVYLDFTGAQVTYGVEHVTWGADQVDFAPLETTVRLVVDLTANVTLRSIAGGVNGRTLKVFNKNNGAFALTLANEDAAGTASMRMRLPTAADVVLYGQEGHDLGYDGADARWNSGDEAAPAPRPVEDRDQLNAVRAFLPRAIPQYDPDASLTVRGYVSLVPQSLGAGAKYFSDKVGIGTTLPLSNSALDVRGYGGVYFAGAVYFGGGNSPAAETDGALLSWNNGTPYEMVCEVGTAGQGAGNMVGWRIIPTLCKMQLLYRTGSTPSLTFLNTDTSAETTVGAAAPGDANMILSGIVYGP